MPFDDAGAQLAPMPFLSVATLAACIPGMREPADWLGPLQRVCSRFGIVSRLRLAAFLAQTGHESGDFNTLSESLDYSPQGLLATWPSRFTPELARALGRVPGRPADQPGIARVVYGGRLGNLVPGDGYRHRGAGLIQLTGHDAHARCGKAFGIATADVPAWLRTKEGAALSAGWYWSERRLNGFADGEEIDLISRLVNGGAHGLADRRLRYQRARRVLFRA